MHGRRKAWTLKPRDLTLAPLPPLRTLTELAEEVGMSRQQLSMALRFSPVDVVPQVRIRTGDNGRVAWYEPVEFRRWWKEHKQMKGMV